MLLFVNNQSFYFLYFNLESETMSSKSRRVLTLVAKCLQNLANQTEFKEQHMVTLNNLFLIPNQPKISSLLLECTNVSVEPVKDPLRKPLSEEDKMRGLSVVMSLFAKHLAVCESEIELDPRMKNPTTNEEAKVEIFSFFVLQKKKKISEKKFSEKKIVERFSSIETVINNPCEGLVLINCFFFFFVCLFCKIIIDY